MIPFLRKTTGAAALGLLAASCQMMAASLKYPPTAKTNVVDNYHGTTVADPYRWLEDDNAPATKDWVEAQNKVTLAYLHKIPGRDAIQSRLTKLWNFERYGVPFKEGGRYFYTRNDGLQNQSVLYTVESLAAAPRVLLDPNTLSKDGTVALAGMAVSDDGNLLAYGLAASGSDWNEWKVRDVRTGQDLADHLQWVKFSGASWKKDGSGFFYSRYDAPKPGDTLKGVNKFQKLYFHRIGTEQSADTLIYERKDQPDWGFAGAVTEDGRWLIITGSQGTDPKNRVLYKDLTRPDAPVTGLLMDFDLKDARSVVKIFALDGKPVREVTLPGLGTAGGFGGKRNDTETFFSFTSFTEPGTIYRHDLATSQSTVFRRPKLDFDESAYETKQVFYSSKDGTKVPMFIVHKRGLKLDGRRPTLLYGYGGFNISLTPSFSVSRAAWLEMGGVYALANLRGGGEYGEDWHQAGTRLHKQNVFDDFIAAAEWLQANRYTSREKLAIQGGSNGGLLVGACMTQRPELYRVALPAVGVMDMLRFHKFTIGWAWASDYGSADNAAEFPALLAYSPYHNLKPGVRYPATMITTADHDDRVVPAHSFKFAARLQEYHRGPNPVLIRIETKAGHGAGKPTSKQIEEKADELAFLTRELGMKPPRTD